MLSREFPPQERGVAMATIGVPALLAPALGPIVGGYLVTFADWRTIFFINVPIGVIAFILATLLLRESRTEGRMRFDVAGFFYPSFRRGGVIYGLSWTGRVGLGSGEWCGFPLRRGVFFAVFLFLWRVVNV